MINYAMPIVLAMVMTILLYIARCILPETCEISPFIRCLSPQNHRKSFRFKSTHHDIYGKDKFVAEDVLKPNKLYILTAMAEP